MGGCLKGCLGAVGLMVVVTAVAYAGWRFGDPYFPRLEDAVRENVGEAVEEGPGAPSPALAEETLDRVDAFRAGEAGSRLELDGVALSSVVRYSLPGIIPPGVHEPAVEMRGGKVFLSARVAMAAFPDLPALDDVVGLLPDTVDIVMRGALEPLDDEYAALRVDRVEASRIPLPARVIPAILRSLGRTDRPGLGEDAFAVPLPSGLASAFVEGDRLVLLGDR